MVTRDLANNALTRSRRHLIEAARTVVGGDADDRSAALGRANARWSQGARWTVEIFTAAFVVGLVLLHVILFPGFLVVIVLVETVIPRRCVVVTAAAAALVAGEPVADPEVAPLPSPPPPRLDERGRAMAARIDGDAAGAAIVALAAASIRADAYFLPWIVMHTTNVTVADGAVVGVPVLSIWFSLAAVAIAIVYLAKRNESYARLLAGMGLVAVLASLLGIVLLFEKISDTRSILFLPGIHLDLSPGAGPWIQMLGAVGILVGGMWGVRIARRDGARRAGNPL